MEFMDVLRGRYSCRKYSEQKVDRETLTALAEAGRIAPSGCNSQRWVFVIVDEEARRQKIAAALIDEELHVNTFAGQIPAFLVVVEHPPRALNDKQRKLLSACDHAMLDIGMAAENICLAATDRGLATVMMGWFRPEAVAEAIGLPDHLKPLLVIGVGHAFQPPVRRTGRLDRGEIIRVNDFANRLED